MTLKGDLSKAKDLSGIFLAWKGAALVTLRAKSLMWLRVELLLGLVKSSNDTRSVGLSLCATVLRLRALLTR